MKKNQNKIANRERLTLTDRREQYAAKIAERIHEPSLTWRELKNNPSALRHIEHAARCSITEWYYLYKLANGSRREKWLLDILDSM